MPDQLPNVLVVDDDQSIVELAVEALNRFGYVAVGRTTPESAIEVANSTPSLQVLLSDICLEAGTGPDLVRRVLRERPGLKVVFMTGGYDNISFRRTDPVLRKPFDLIRLRKTIEGIFNRAEPAFEKKIEGERRRLAI